MSASLAVGLAGVLVALAALTLTAWESRTRRGADEAERHARAEEIALVRRQAEASEAASEAARSADVRVKCGRRIGQEWKFDLVNAGPATAHSVQAWIARADQSKLIPVGNLMLELAGPLLPGQGTEGLRFALPLSDELAKEGVALTIYVAWEDTHRRTRRDDYPIDL